VSLTIKGRPIRFSLKWLKPPPVPPDGAMTLFEHLRELRYRLVVASLAIIAATVLAAFFYQFLFALLTRPYFAGIEDLKASNPEAITELVNIDLTSPLRLAVQVCLVAGLVLSGPVWLYQLWAFIVPGLLAKEKKWALMFIGLASPLFALGVATAYYVLPKAIAVLLGFTAEGVANLQDINTFLSFMLRPDPGHLRHLRLRGRGHAVDRPVLHAGPGPADDRAVPGRRGHRPCAGPAQGPPGRGDR
jgi:sec-independent protein translocase protein TatC